MNTPKIREKESLPNPRHPTDRRQQKHAQNQARSATRSNKRAKEHPKSKERITKSERKTKTTTNPIQFRCSNTNKKKRKKHTRWKEEKMVRQPNTEAERLGKIVRKWWRFRKRKKEVKGCRGRTHRLQSPGTNNPSPSPGAWWISVRGCWCLVTAIGVSSPGVSIALEICWRLMRSQPSLVLRTKETDLKRSEKQNNNPISGTDRICHSSECFVLLLLPVSPFNHGWERLLSDRKDAGDKEIEQPDDRRLEDERIYEQNTRWSCRYLKWHQMSRQRETQMEKERTDQRTDRTQHTKKRDSPMVPKVMNMNSCFLAPSPHLSSPLVDGSTELEKMKGKSLVRKCDNRKYEHTNVTSMGKNKELATHMNSFRDSPSRSGEGLFSCVNSFDITTCFCIDQIEGE